MGANILPFRSIDDLTVSVYKTGSSVICDPPVLDTDTDYLVLVEDDRLDECGARLQKYRWDNCFTDWASKQDTDPVKPCEDQYTVETETGVRFQAWRKGKDNLIVTDDLTFYLRSVGATLLAKELNLQSKGDRTALFRCIKYGDSEVTGEYAKYMGPLP